MDCRSVSTLFPARSQIYEKASQNHQGQLTVTGDQGYMKRLAKYILSQKKASVDL